jgi:hypothetical protein
VEPRIVDHMLASSGGKNAGDEYAVLMLGGMLRDETGASVGPEFIRNLPLRMFSRLTSLMESLDGEPPAPLPSSAEASSA